MYSQKSLMMRALGLARRGVGRVVPNPMVGAIVVKGGKVVGRGWHRQYGASHAEVEALRDAGERAEGAELYVTLEPCNHRGQTGPCVQAIIDAGIERVYQAMTDPNPNVKGAGRAALEAAGIEVISGLCEREARLLNEPWLKSLTAKRPFVTLKLAISSDNKIADSSGNSKWISSTISRAQVQRLRSHADAIIVGSKTIAIDNPRLNNRSCRGVQPLCVVVDPKLKISLESEIFNCVGRKVLLVAAENAAEDRRQELEQAGVEILCVGSSENDLDLKAVLAELHVRGVQSVLCEGGAYLGSAMLAAGLVDRLLLYRAQKELGKNGLGWFSSSNYSWPIYQQLEQKLVASRKVGPDILAEYRGLH